MPKVILLSLQITFSFVEHVSLGIHFASGKESIADTSYSLLVELVGWKGVSFLLPRGS